MISIVIPTRDEAANIASLLAVLAAEPEPHECIVVDAGADATAALAAQAGARVIASAPGRGRQIRAGVEAASGSVIWMLHADCQVPRGCLAAIRRALATPHIVGGNFRLLFDGQDRFRRSLDGFYA